MVSGQLIYVASQGDPSTLWLVDVTHNGCEVSIIGDMGIEATDIAICPGGGAFATDGESLYSLDLTTGATTLITTWDFQQADFITSLACTWDAYVMMAGANLWVNGPFGAHFLGPLPFGATGDLVYHNAQWYYSTFWGLYAIDINSPSHGDFIVTPGPGIHGLAGSINDCNQLYAGNQNGDILWVDVSFADYDVHCGINGAIAGMATLDDFEPSEYCDTLKIDLDADNSGGQLFADFHGLDVTCRDTAHHVSDVDVKVNSTEEIVELRIVQSWSPDAPLEGLYLNNANNINIIGNGTTSLTLRNAGGAATAKDFQRALKNVEYRNLAPLPTEGTRNFTVEFDGNSGRKSNLARSSLDVKSKEVTVDIGPDLWVCEETLNILDAGNDGMDFNWSTGSDNQTIEVYDEGWYSVTVTDPKFGCSDVDSMYIQTERYYGMSLEGEDTICFGEFATVQVHTDYVGLFDLYIESDYSPADIPYPGVMDGSHIDIFAFQSGIFYPTFVTTYNGPSCFYLDTASISIEVFLQTIEEVPDTICDGDSVWLDNDWQFETGVYRDQFTSQQGCDSTIYTYLEVLPNSESYQEYGSCNPGDTGTFIDHYVSANGCDSAVTTYVYYQESHNTYLSTQSCDPLEAGLDTVILTNQLGCDSVVITETIFVESVTTLFDATSCDINEIGFDTAYHVSALGCDSLVITETTFVPSYDTYLLSYTCDQADAGLDSFLYISSNGCDSLVIDEKILAPDYEELVVVSSCDPADIGRDTLFLSSQFGCDSLIITEVTLSPSDLLHLDQQSCDPVDEGVDSFFLQNSYGCDSIVIVTTELVESYETVILQSSCAPSDTGTVSIIYQSTFGCDSVVITTTSLDPESYTEILGTTCMPSEARDETIIFSNQYGCDSTVVYDIAYIPLDTTFYAEIVCDQANVQTIIDICPSVQGCDSVVIMDFVLGTPQECSIEAYADGDTVDCNNPSGSIKIELEEGEHPISWDWTRIPEGQQANGQHLGPDLEFQIDNLQPGSYEINIRDVNGESAFLVAVVEEVLPPEISASVTSDFNGFGISCFETADGEAEVVILSGGESPFNYEWSNGSQSPSIGNLAAGSYHVTVTDWRGCSDVDSVLLTEPTMLELMWEVKVQECWTGLGAIEDISAAGGVQPYTFTVNDSIVSDFADLEPGNYQLAVEDNNGCTLSEFVEIPEATPPFVTLGPNQTVNLGDSVELNVQTDIPDNQVESITWSDGLCDGCTSRDFYLLSSAGFWVDIVRDDGCTSRAEVYIGVIFDDDVYIPNAFSPNGDGINDHFRIFDGGQIRKVESMVITDRWGNKVFERFDVDSANPSSHWDGTFKGKPFDNGVFAYYVQLRMKDGSIRKFSGDLIIAR